MTVAGKAIDYMNNNNEFEIRDFEQSLDDPELIDQFTRFREDYGQETGTVIEDQFNLSAPEARKAKKRLKGKLKLDTGAELLLSSAFIDQADDLLERGYDKEKEMNFLKIYFDKQLQ